MRKYIHIAYKYLPDNRSCGNVDLDKCENGDILVIDEEYEHEIECSDCKNLEPSRCYYAYLRPNEIEYICIRCFTREQQSIFYRNQVLYHADEKFFLKRDFNLKQGEFIRMSNPNLRLVD